MKNNTNSSADGLRIAMLSIHSSPTGPLGTRDTGGMSVYVRELARYLGRLGHRVDIFTYCRGEDKALSSNVRLVHLVQSHDRDLDKETLPAFLPQVFEALAAYAGTHAISYDLIHSHYWLSGIVGAMAQARWHCPHITMFHTLAKVKNDTHSGEDEPNLRIGHEQWLAKTTDHILVPTTRERDNLIRYYHARPTRISLVPCGVDLRLFKPMGQHRVRQVLDLPQNAPVMLFVGRFAALKGLDQLIQATAQLLPRYSDLHLVIVGGDGPNAPTTVALQRLARELNLSRQVRFVGKMDQELLPMYYNAADFLVLPSHYESFGLVVLEALACGTPVVATRVGVVEALIRDGFNGSIIESPHYGAVAAAIGRILDQPKAQWATPTSIRSTVHRFSWQHIATAVAETYAQVMTAHDPNRLPLHYEHYEHYDSRCVLPN